MVQFSAALRQFRKSQRMTQGELGQLVGVPQSTISKWEKGAQQPDAEHAAKLSQAIGTPLGILFGFEEMKQAEFESSHKDKPVGSDAHEVPKHHPAWGALKGMITLLPGVDYTEPADPEWGKVYED
ncbi:MAG: helix-turn-helix transcriptional regulator [Devosia sp.]|nr:helix-turn-helix transcriptional regulator [Devosia sp.]